MDSESANLVRRGESGSDRLKMLGFENSGELGFREGVEEEGLDRRMVEAEEDKLGFLRRRRREDEEVRELGFRRVEEEGLDAVNPWMFGLVSRTERERVERF